MKFAVLIAESKNQFDFLGIIEKYGEYINIRAVMSYVFTVLRLFFVHKIRMPLQSSVITHLISVSIYNRF